jgi:hypothetical protein
VSIYTIVLRRPLSLTQAADEDIDHDIYVAIGIEANNLHEAVVAARQEVYDADVKEWGKRALSRMEIDPGEYTMLLVFEGAHRPIAWPWSPVAK